MENNGYIGITINGSGDVEKDKMIEIEKDIEDFIKLAIMDNAGRNGMIRSLLSCWNTYFSRSPAIEKWGRETVLKVFLKLHSVSEYAETLKEVNNILSQS